MLEYFAFYWKNVLRHCFTVEVVLTTDEVHLERVSPQAALVVENLLKSFVALGTDRLHALLVPVERPVTKDQQPHVTQQ